MRHDYTELPFEQLAEIELSTGPPSIRDENGVPAGFVFVPTPQVSD